MLHIMTRFKYPQKPTRPRLEKGQGCRVMIERGSPVQGEVRTKNRDREGEVR